MGDYSIGKYSFLVRVGDHVSFLEYDTKENDDALKQSLVISLLNTLHSVPLYMAL